MAPSLALFAFDLTFSASASDFSSSMATLIRWSRVYVWGKTIPESGRIHKSTAVNKPSVSRTKPRLTGMFRDVMARLRNRRDLEDFIANPTFAGEVNQHFN
mmetsp:Transcript_17340/g.29904  ORF Transcript_17340/g.29904 Transcript_17340/m.29904 type:complete len:101 (+) Transcript_17340:1148-1450(+)